MVGLLNQSNFDTSGINNYIRCCPHECPHDHGGGRAAQTLGYFEFTFPHAPNHPLDLRSIENNHLSAAQGPRYHGLCNAQCAAHPSRTGRPGKPSVNKNVGFYTAIRGFCYWGHRAATTRDPKDKIVKWWELVKDRVQAGPWQDLVFAIGPAIPLPLHSPFTDGSFGPPRAADWAAKIWRKQYPDLWCPGHPGKPSLFDISAAMAPAPLTAEPHLHHHPPTPQHPHVSPRGIPKGVGSDILPESPPPGFSDSSSVLVSAGSSSLSEGTPRILFAISDDDGALRGASWNYAEALNLVQDHAYWVSLTKCYPQESDTRVKEFLLDVVRCRGHPARPFIFPRLSASPRCPPDWLNGVEILLREWMELVLNLLQKGADVRVTTQKLMFRDVRTQTGSNWDWLLVHPLHTVLVFGTSYLPPIHLNHPDFRASIACLHYAGVKMWPDVYLQDPIRHKNIFPFVLHKQVELLGGHVYLPQVYLTPEHSLSQMKGALTSQLMIGAVVKATVGAGGEAVVLPSKSSAELLDHVVTVHYKRYAEMRKAHGDRLDPLLIPHLMSVPFNPFLANQGEVRFYFVNGKVLQAIHTSPTPPKYPRHPTLPGVKQDDLGRIIRQDATNHLTPLDQLTTGHWDERIDEDKHSWIDRNCSSRDPRRGYQEAEKFATGIYQSLCSLELLRQGERFPETNRAPGPVPRANRLLVRIDITVVRLLLPDGGHQYKYQLHEIQEGCCGLFRSREESGGGVTKAMADYLMSWGRQSPAQQ
ncbi:hypothetical protein PQX77_020856 [Marasmius sp. AFHP31]|nr:hypothetical protein PQX77_020856 [Marasmius sp. AFHP31]